MNWLDVVSFGPYSSRLDYSDSAEALVEKGRDLIGKYRERIDYFLERLPENAMELELWATYN